MYTMVSGYSKTSFMNDGNRIVIGRTNSISSFLSVAVTEWSVTVGKKSRLKKKQKIRFFI